MHTYTQVFRRSLKTAGVILAANAAVAFSSVPFGFSALDVFGNLLLLETAALFIVAGVLDFGSSAGITRLREVIFSSKEGFSSTKRREHERSALAFIIAGLILMVIMILIAIADLSSVRV